MAKGDMLTSERFGFDELRPADGRSVLVFCPRKTPPVDLSLLRAQGWGVTHVSKPQAAHALMDRMPGGVGVLCLGAADEALVPEAEALLEHGDTRFRWVAVLDHTLLKNEALNRVVAHCCLDFHVVPVESTRLLHSLGHAWGMAVLGRNRRFAATEARVENNIIGRSPAMLDAFQRIRKISQSDAPVLIQGETGTGKELCALAIHANSVRTNAPFIAVNCGALPDKLIQSELFGHEKGAFTGAHQRKIGRIEAAAGGTLFLDEIGDLSLDLQVNLLRVLQEGTYERVGGMETLMADMRVVAATHVNIEHAVTEKRFREDLYYRLNVLRLEVPPLRGRKGDVELLARHWFNAFAKEKNPQVKGFSRSALEAMRQHDWPGNVRELINRVRRAMVMCERSLILPADLGLTYDVRSVPAAAKTLAEAREEAERTAITGAMGQCGRNLSAAARQLGISRVTLYRLLEKHEIAY